MQSQNSQQVKKVILLPTKFIPEQIASLVSDLKDLSVRFINGYRNILQTVNQNQVRWALVQNEDFCGQAFCYLLKAEVNKEDLLKKQLQGKLSIKEVNDQMFIVQSSSQDQFPEVKLSKEKINQLIEQVMESKQNRKLAVNLLKNASASYESFQKNVGEIIQQIEKQISSEKEQKIPTLTQTIALELEAKKLKGEMISKLPKCNQQTGDWDQNELVEIKLSDK